MNWGYLLSILLVSGLCALIGGGLIVTHYVLVSKGNASTALRREEEAAELWFSLLWSRYGTWLTVAMFWLICFTGFLMRSLEFFRWNHLFPCAVLVKFVSVESKIAKLCGYSVLVSHCHVVFQIPAFAYSRRFIHAIYAVIALAVAIFCTFDMILLTGSNEHMDYASNGRHVEKGSKASLTVCVLDMAPVKVASAFFVLFDTLLSLFILALFVRPLKSLLKQQRDFSREQRSSNLMDISMELLPLKYTSIVATNILAAVLLVISLSVVRTPIFLLLYCVVNIFCFLTMTKYWAAVYWTVFGPLMLCISRVPGFGERNRENVRAVIAHYRGNGMPTIVKMKSHSGITGSGKSKSHSTKDSKNGGLKSASSKGTLTV